MYLFLKSYFTISQLKYGDQGNRIYIILVWLSDLNVLIFISILKIKNGIHFIYGKWGKK